MFALLSVLVIASVFSTVVFEKAGFSDLKGWVVSDAIDNAGEWVVTSGSFAADEAAQSGIKTAEDARKYAISTAFDAVDTTGKDLVFTFTLRNEQDLKCGGAYVKLLAAGFDADTFNGDTDYSIMFGPDRCGFGTNKIHLILSKDGNNIDWKKSPQPTWNTATHIYSVIIRPDNTYQVLEDLEVIESGLLKDDWDLLAPREIPDPSATKPEDWVDEPLIADPEADKPEDWPEDAPQLIPDPEAELPEEWDEEEDGEWVAPLIPNPEYRGEWSAPMIENPNYKGIWSAPLIANPEFVDDDSVYARSFGGIGIEVWQVEAGSIFNNFFVAVGEDAIAENEAFSQKVWGSLVDAELEAREAFEAESAAVDGDDQDDDDDLDEHDL